VEQAGKEGPVKSTVGLVAQKGKEFDSHKQSAKMNLCASHLALSHQKKKTKEMFERVWT
jgi:hypothetical protein